MSKTYVGSRLRQLRRERDLSQASLASTLGLSASYVNQIEHDVRPLTVPVLMKITEVFGVDATNGVIGRLKEFQNWAFALAFTSIGLETNFKELCSQVQGGKPFHLYIVGQLFNLVLTFAVVWLLLSGRIFPVPVLAA